MKLLIDTNVILDMVFQRNGCDDSMKLFRKIRENGDSAYITASSVTEPERLCRCLAACFDTSWLD